MRLIALLMFALFSLTAPSVAASDDIAIEKAWARKTSRTVSAAAYFSLTNHGHETLTLTGASTDIAGTTMIHRSYEDGGMMRMDHMEEIAVAPGETLEFAPGGYHVMMMGLMGPLEEGESFTVTLEFEHHDPITVTVQVTGMMGLK
jgi:copper(I)-binding protein